MVGAFVVILLLVPGAVAGLLGYVALRLLFRGSRRSRSGNPEEP
jgi:hypothetical protein